MNRRVTCNRCGAVSEYDNQSVWEGNREFEDVYCPTCKNKIGRVFTDLTPRAQLIEEKNDREDI